MPAKSISNDHPAGQSQPAEQGHFNAIPGALCALILGWGPVAAVALAGVTWVSSSGVIAKVLRDLRRLGNRETPTILSILVLEDLAMAFYLPVLSALAIGAGVLAGATALVIAVLVVIVILYLALRHGHVVSRLFAANHAESLLLGVLGLTMLVAGIAEEVKVSVAVGAFLVGIALSGRVAQNAQQLLAPLRDLFAAVFFVFFGLSTEPASIPPVLLPAAILAVITIATKTFSLPANPRTDLAVMGDGQKVEIYATIMENMMRRG